MRARRAAERSGRWAESAAAWLLKLKGYRIVERRFRTPQGEIDLVARRGSQTVFVEVKRRHAAQAGLEALQPRQQRRIRNAAAAYLARRSGGVIGDCRFDLIVVTPWRWPRHIQDIWRD